MALNRSLLRRIEQLQAEGIAHESAQAFDLRRLLFEQQLPFGLDQSRYQTVVTPRRAGKTFAIAGKLLATAIAKRGSVALYITLSRLNAKRIVWGTLKAMHDACGLGGKIQEAELCISWPDGTRIFLTGAKDSSEIENFRGLPISIAIIDEAQSFPSYLEPLIDEVIAPALTDYSGTMALVGTPGPVPVGYFFERTKSESWAHHGWSVFDNFHLQKKSGRPIRDLLNDELKRRGVTENDPAIQREWFGRWVHDENSLVFRYSKEKNSRQPKQCTNFVIGIDLGFEDSDAIVVLGWRDDSDEVDLVSEWVGAKQTITPLMERVKATYEKYQPLAVVCDMGGLGKKIAEEIQTRMGVPVEAAEKTRKFEHIELLNDAMRTGKFFAPPDSRFASDCMMVEWDRDRNRPDRLKISDRFHSDVCDAVLYAWRRCQHWLFEAKPSLPARNSPEWLEAQQREQLAEIERSFEAQLLANKRLQHEERESESWGM